MTMGDIEPLHPDPDGLDSYFDLSEPSIPVSTKYSEITPDAVMARFRGSLYMMTTSKKGITTLSITIDPKDKLEADKITYYPGMALIFEVRKQDFTKHDD